MHWSACAYAHADKCIYFKQVHMLTLAAYHFNSSVHRVIDQWQVSHALCNFGRKKCGVRDDIKYTWTNLKIVRLGIARTHGWVELAPMVLMSSSHRSSTVNPEIRKKILNAKSPTIEKQVKKNVLGMLRYYHKFVRIYAKILLLFMTSWGELRNSSGLKNL